MIRPQGVVRFLVVATSRLFRFACPNCGTIRPVSRRALREIEVGNRKGTCPPGEGCRVAVPKGERLKRWWLAVCGVSETQIRLAGGADAFVLEFGMPELPVQPPLARYPPAPPVRHGFGKERSRSRLSFYCCEQADGDPELALWLAVEIVGRGILDRPLVAA